MTHNKVLRDYADRSRLIASADDPANPAKAHYRRLIAKGLSETDASSMSGYEHCNDFDSLARYMRIWAGIALVLWLLIYYSDAVGQLPELRNTESAFAACLSWQNVTFDRAQWYCVRAIEE